ncbi:hypothetical protein [Streptomyces echinatus]|uniref:hypothetical protein n=1 Tax=Streptomyces echinatus TaxID=67293 RepID=UPI0037A5EF81
MDVDACKGEEYFHHHLPERRELHDLWVKARMEERGTLKLKKPNLRYVADSADLSQALRALYEYAGAPSLREIQQHSGEPLHLPLSTLARIVNRETIPADERQLVALLRGCQVQDEQHAGWKAAWRKAM